MAQWQSTCFECRFQTQPLALLFVPDSGGSSSSHGTFHNACAQTAPPKQQQQKTVRMARKSKGEQSLDASPKVP